MLVAMSQRLRHLQFPSRCAGHTVLGIKDGGRFWGSLANIWSVRMASVFKAKSPPIFAPVFVGWSMGYDKDYCKGRHMRNGECMGR
jgi:hypothetical protein